MKNQRNPWAVGAFISAVSPNLIAFAMCIWQYVLQPDQKSDMDFFSGSPLAVLPLLGSLLLGFRFISSFWTVLLGIISIVLAILAIRRSQTGGKGLALVALVLSTIQIAIVSRGLMAQALR